MHRISGALTHYFTSAHGADPTGQSHQVIYNLLRQQAGMLAYVDCYFVLSLGFLFLIPFVFMLKPTRTKGMAMGH